MRLLFLPALLLLIAAGDTPAFQIDHPWARASAGAAKNGAAFMVLTVKGTGDKLTGFASPVAASAELHETIDDKGIMKMRPVPNLTLEPGKPVTLAPGGYHVMLMGLKAPLKAGDAFPLTLKFEHAPDMTITVNVEGMGGMGGMGGVHTHK